ncbi:cell wall-binding repeat-containing protein [Bacillus timonensis]|uniref:cell wall-binding repeat-containing protein n=1 Tax=Bacillus timonensis TaxID=1033734 RepID=UPI00028985F0|nr:cell wall-binding repeat-containing protein [Bacillus timonensis]
MNKRIFTFTLAITLFISNLFVPEFHDFFGAEKAEAADFNRIAGKTRYDTAVSISKLGWENAESVVLANGTNFPDALAGAPLSYALEAPILLVKKDTIPQSTLDEIRRLKATTIYLLGGTAAISNDVVNQLKNKGYKVTRVSGKTRYATAREIGNQLRKMNTQDTAVLAYGLNYPDALGIGGVASENGWPILFSNSTKLDNDTKQVLTNWGIKKVIIIGGTGVIKDAVAQEIANLGISTERISGADRSETSIKVAKKFYQEDKGIILSTSRDFPDALAGGPLAGKLKRPIILVNPTKASQSVLNYIDSTGTDSITILGGTGAVSDRIKDDISTLYTGNSVGNIINGAIAAIEGDWIYYINIGDAFIYKVKIDGSGKKKLTNEPAEYISVLDGWIYYSNVADDRTIYKMKIDGTNKKKLDGTSGEFLNVVDDWIYYIDYYQGREGVYKVKTDGSQLTKIKKGYYTGLNVVNDWMYFYSTQEGPKNPLYKVKIDGSSLTMLDKGNQTEINVVGDWIYYIDQSNQAIYKMKTNGSSKIKIANASADRLNISGDWMYYRNTQDDRKIYKMKTDGTSKQKVSNETWVRNINIVGDWIDYISPGNSGEDHQYRIKK